ncbi:MAG: DUF2797 domain-containing protein [Candidatus Heimdallarchaeota archaeon]|nr:DUF2797 domain-containing protein [Candidatus Heimdallarchaeota archaeon]
MNKFVLHTGWKMKPKPMAYILYITKDSKHEQILELVPRKPLTIRIPANEPKFCIGFNNPQGERIPCPTVEIIPQNKVQCQSCSLNEFYLCRAYCQGDFCHPSSEEAREYCWKTITSVYLTSISGRIKVGSSTNPLRRWIDQGSDAGIIIGQGVGLDPRALEYQIGTKLSLTMAVRTSQKINYLGKQIDRKQISEHMSKAIEEVYSSIKSETLVSRDKLEEITFLDEFYGEISKIQMRPQIKKRSSEGLEIGGTIIGVKGSILVLKNLETYFATNLNDLIGSHVLISEESIEMKGQKSLFDFV